MAAPSSDIPADGISFEIAFERVFEVVCPNAAELNAAVDDAHAPYQSESEQTESRSSMKTTSMMAFHRPFHGPRKQQGRSRSRGVILYLIMLEKIVEISQWPEDAKEGPRSYGTESK
jgi:hypothetical protein